MQHIDTDTLLRQLGNYFTHPVVDEMIWRELLRRGWVWAE